MSTWKKNIGIAFALGVLMIMHFGAPPAPWPLAQIHQKMIPFIEPLGLNSSGRYFSASFVQFVVGLYKVESEDGIYSLEELVKRHEHFTDLPFQRESMIQQKLGMSRPYAEAIAASYGKRLCQKNANREGYSVYRAYRKPLSPDLAQKGEDVSTQFLLSQVEKLTTYRCEKLQ